jgi:hypothetical protein
MSRAAEMKRQHEVELKGKVLMAQKCLDENEKTRTELIENQEDIKAIISGKRAEYVQRINDAAELASKKIERLATDRLARVAKHNAELNAVVADPSLANADDILGRVQLDGGIEFFMEELEFNPFQCCAGIEYAERVLIYDVNSELYDIATNTFQPVDTRLNEPITHSSAATLFPSGHILVCGGMGNTGGADWYDVDYCRIILDTVECARVFNPPRLNKKRGCPAAVFVGKGIVHVFGGHNLYGYENTYETFDRDTMNFKMGKTNMHVARGYHSANLLPNLNQVFICGGLELKGKCCAETELFDVNTETFMRGYTQTQRFGHTAVTLQDGRVFISGGRSNALISSCEFYDPLSGKFQSAPNLPVARTSHSATLLPNGNVLIVGGLPDSKSTLFFDPKMNRFLDGPVSIHKHSHHTAAVC